MPLKDEQPTDQPVSPLLFSGDEIGAERDPQNKAKAHKEQHRPSRATAVRARLARWLPVLASLLPGAMILGFGIIALNRADGLPFGLAGVFLGTLLLAATAASSRAEGQQQFAHQALIPLETGLRVAVILAFFILVGLELNLLKSVLAANGFVAKLLNTPLSPAQLMNAQPPGYGLVIGVVQAAPAPQAAGISWPSAFVLAVLIIAMTALVLITLSTIWRIVKEDW